MYQYVLYILFAIVTVVVLRVTYRLFTKPINVDATIQNVVINAAAADDDVKNVQGSA